MTQDDDAAAHERTAGEPSLAIDDAHFKLTWRQVDRGDRVLESFVKNGIDGVFYNLWTQKKEQMKQETPIKWTKPHAICRTSVLRLLLVDRSGSR